MFLFKFSKAIFITSFFLIGFLSQKAFSQSDEPKTRADVLSSMESGNLDFSGEANLGETNFREPYWELLGGTGLAISGVVGSIKLGSISQAYLTSNTDWPLWTIEAGIIVPVMVLSMGCILGSCVVMDRWYEANLRRATYNKDTISPKNFNPKDNGIVKSPDGCKKSFLESSS